MRRQLETEAVGVVADDVDIKEDDCSCRAASSSRLVVIIPRRSLLLGRSLYNGLKALQEVRNRRQGTLINQRSRRNLRELLLGEFVVGIESFFKQR
jgi:hypothetical protein